MGFAETLAGGDLAVRGQLGEATLIYTPSIGPPVTVTGIFDDGFVVADGGVGVSGVASTSPAAWFALSDLPSDPTVDVGARVTRGSTVYSCYEAKPDGQGNVLMLLSKV